MVVVGVMMVVVGVMMVVVGVMMVVVGVMMMVVGVRRTTRIFHHFQHSGEKNTKSDCEKESWIMRYSLYVKIWLTTFYFTKL